MQATCIKHNDDTHTHRELYRSMETSTMYSYSTSLDSLELSGYEDVEKLKVGQ